MQPNNSNIHVHVYGAIAAAMSVSSFDESSSAKWPLTRRPSESAAATACRLLLSTSPSPFIITQPNNIGITTAKRELDRVKRCVRILAIYLATVTAKINESFYLPLTPGVPLSVRNFAAPAPPKLLVH